MFTTGKQTENAECEGVQCQVEDAHRLRKVESCSFRLVETYQCVGAKCKFNHVATPCEDEQNSSGPAPLGMRSATGNDSSYRVDIKLLIILVVTVTSICVGFTCFITIFVARKCQRGNRTGGERNGTTGSRGRASKMYELVDPMVAASPASRPVSAAHDTLGICSDSFNMSSSTMLPYLWNREQPLATFNDNDQPINNGFFSVDYR